MVDLNPFVAMITSFSIASAIARLASGPCDQSSPFVPSGSSEAQLNASPIGSSIVRQDQTITTQGDWGHWLRYLRGDTHGAKDLVVLAVTLKPGQAPHPPHRHAEEELMILTKGTGIWHLDGKQTAANEGDVLYAAPWSV